VSKKKAKAPAAKVDHTFHGIKIVKDEAEFDNRKDALAHLETLGYDKAKIYARGTSFLDGADFYQNNYEWTDATGAVIAHEQISGNRKQTL
jgi:hypothetical protein